MYIAIYAMHAIYATFGKAIVIVMCSTTVTRIDLSCNQLTEEGGEMVKLFMLLMMTMMVMLMVMPMRVMMMTIMVMVDNRWL